MNTPELLQPSKAALLADERLYDIAMEKVSLLRFEPARARREFREEVLSDPTLLDVMIENYLDDRIRDSEMEAKDSNSGNGGGIPGSMRVPAGVEFVDNGRLGASDGRLQAQVSGPVHAPRKTTPQRAPQHAFSSGMIAASRQLNNEIGKSFFETYRLADGRSIGDINYTEIPRLIRRACKDAYILLHIYREYSVNPTLANAYTVREIVTEARLAELIRAKPNFADVAAYLAQQQEASHAAH